MSGFTQYDSPKRKSIWDADLTAGDRVCFENLNGNLIEGFVASIDEADPCIVKIRLDSGSSYDYLRLRNAVRGNLASDRWIVKPPNPKYSPQEIIERFTEGR